ncbi:Ectonucleotide pyrophosphatase/phosphodiesterase family member 3 [Toxocara canis]|uniref:Ectonucleotide pyrophosphatase/phosphodiesterase family member 3 n=1 Tax=Toxocara canis TaxID=6265 RepID=A0A0B2V0H8_TOXCA|nr:Ectonucleotide pyrophosphatase/phosphodiesterase family member 3 [Toxocara canis]
MNDKRLTRTVAHRLTGIVTKGTIGGCSMTTVAPEEPGGTEKSKNERKSSPRALLTLVGAALIVTVILLVLFIVLYAVERSKKGTDGLSISEALLEAKCDLRKCTRSFKSPPLVILSMDGFRASYLYQNITPAVERIMDCGVHSKYVLPSFPSKTFPNHYTIATGLYPAWSGIVDNGFYDPNVPENYFKKSTHSPGWYLGEPIWNTVQKFGMKSAVYFWPGSEAPANGMMPNIYMPYNSTVPFTQRIDKVIEWLNLPDDERPSLIQVYVEQPDAAGHEGGPDSQIVRTAMVSMDGILNYFTEKLLEEGLMGCINLVIVSDHGMQYINSSRAVVMEELLPQPFNEALFTGAIAHISLLNNDTSVDGLIETMRCQHGKNYLTFKTKLVPARYHYSGSKRIGEVVIVGRAGALIYKTRAQADADMNWHGNHGFDNRIISMRTIFAAIGPDIAEKKEISEFQNVELYNLFADLLHVTAAPNNGTKGHLYSVLRNPPTEIPEKPSTITTLQCTPKPVIENCNSSCPSVPHIYDSCTPSTATIASFNAHDGDCVVSLCEGVIHYNSNLHVTQLVETMITSQNWNSKSTDTSCVRYVEGLSNSNECGPLYSDNMTTISLFINKADYNSVNVAFMTVTSGFANGTWRYLINKIDGYVKQYGNMMMYSGPVYDNDGDGHRDTDNAIELSLPSHIFVIVFRCASGEMISPQLCHDVTFIPFVLPVVDEDFNCLDPEEYLYQNTARILDIELLTGFQFFTNRTLWTSEEAILLRTRVTQSMW